MEQTGTITHERSIAAEAMGGLRDKSEREALLGRYWAMGRSSIPCS